MTTHYDAIVIGTGQAGPSLASRMNDEGLRVAVIERDRMGGSCVNYGCIPTKTLVASARVAHMARRAAEYGVVLDGPVKVDLERVKERMRAVSGQSNRGVESWLEGMPKVDLLRGHARFVGPRAVEVNGKRLKADRVFLNVGTRAFIPDLPGASDVPYLTSTDLLASTELPQHLIVIGGSYIGLELGQIYRRFGSEVTIVERGPRLIGRDDPDVSTAVQEILEKGGIRVRCDADCLGLERRDEGVAITTQCDESEPEIVGTHVLLAVGRRPNTDSLDLESAGVTTNDRGFVEVDEQLRTSAEGVWALGDCNGRGAFTHTSYNDYEIVAANLFDADKRRVSDRILCYGLFIDPPLGRVGMTEAQARESGRRVLVGRYPMSNVGRAKERGETDGFIKILVDAKSEEILGAAILGINGDEAVHALLVAMYAGHSYKAFARGVHIHPTVAELLPTTLQNLEPLEG